MQPNTDRRNHDCRQECLMSTCRMPCRYGRWWSSRAGTRSRGASSGTAGCRYADGLQVCQTFQHIDCFGGYSI